MRFLIILLLMYVAPARAFCAQERACASPAQTETAFRKSGEDIVRKNRFGFKKCHSLRLKWLKYFIPGKRSGEVDKLALWALGLSCVPIVASLIGAAIGGFYLGAFVLIYASIFWLAGTVVGAIAILKSFTNGWKRSTIWAVVAILLPAIVLASLWVLGS